MQRTEERAIVSINANLYCYTMRETHTIQIDARS